MDARAELIDALDDVLVTVQRVPRRPGYRQRLLGPLDLPGGLSAFRVLRAVERMSTRTPSIGEIAEALTVDPSTASRIVERCVADGLVAREPHADDRRKAQLQLTATGSELLAQASRNRRDLFAEIVEGWADDDLAQLTTQLRVLLQGLDKLEADA